MPVPTGIIVTASEEGCVISGTPTLITNGSYNIVATNKSKDGGSSTFGLEIIVRVNQGAPDLEPTYPIPAAYYIGFNKKYFFKKVGGIAELCYTGDYVTEGGGTKIG